MTNFEAYYQSRAPGLVLMGGELRGPCPIHNGKRNSFSVNTENGRWRCHSECDKGGYVYELEQELTGKAFKDIKGDVDKIIGIEDQPKDKGNGKIVATYDYCDADGKMVYQVVRWEPKNFTQRQPDGKGGWVWNLKGLDRLLYRLPDVLHRSSGPVYLLEGEKDVDAARAAWDINATCNSGGAGKMTAAMAKSIAGRDVVIIRDQDEPNPKTGKRPGHDHAEHAATLLTLEGCKVKIIDLPAHDAADWIAAGGTKTQLKEIVLGAQLWQAMPVRAESQEEAPTQGDLPANVWEMLKNYTILVGSEMIWCNRSRRTMRQPEVKLAHHADYGDWVKHPDVRKVDLDKLVFKPAGAGRGEMNIFKGLTMTPDITKPHQRLVEHIAFICGGDPYLTHWLTAWLAYPIQHIGAKMQTAIVVHGPQGTGKSILFETIAKMYEPYSDIIGQSEIDSAYTGWASQKLFILADEVLSKAERAHAKNRLKSYITGGVIGIEEKFKARRVEENHMNLVFLSNEDTPIIIEKSDRRYTVIKLDTIKTEAYYDVLGAEIDAGGAAGLMAYLKAYDLRGFGPHTKPILNQAKEDLTNTCANSADRFMDAWIAGETPLPYGCAIAGDLYEAYKIWANISGERFGLLAHNVFGSRVSERFTKMKCHIDGARPWVIAPSGASDRDECTAFKRSVDEWLKVAQGRRL